MQNTMQLNTKQPAGAWVLFFIQIFSTITFAVLFSSLAFYVTGKLHLSTILATSIVGSFLALNYGLHLLGGYIGGRFFSYRVLFLLGMILQAISCIFFAKADLNVFYIALAFFLTGAGLNMICINCLLTQLYTPTDTRREKAFLWNYSGMNLGYFIGYFIGGYFQKLDNYTLLFTLCACSFVISAFIVLVNFSKLEDKGTSHSQLKTRGQKISSAIIGFGLMLILFFSLQVLMQHSVLSSYLMEAVGIFMVLYIFFLSFQENKEARKKMICFVLLTIFSALFWALYFILPNGLSIFIFHNVDRTLVNYLIPPQWFLNINPFIIIFIGPLLAPVFRKLRMKGYNITVPFQFTIAFFLMAVGFLILPLGMHFANAQGYTHMGWVILSYVLQTLGELFLSPIGYAMIGELGPTRLQGIMMGVWMLMIGVGGALGGILSGIMVNGNISLTNPLVTNGQFFHTFLRLGIVMSMSAVLLLCLLPMLNRLLPAKTVS